jgi:hypothetical protein
MPGNNQEGMMILGSVGTGLLVGLSGALMMWSAGHSPAVVLLAYSTMGSLGTLFIAAATNRRKADLSPERD